MIRRQLRLWQQAIRFWLDSEAVQHAAALAFFTLFSLAPVVILAVQVIGLVLSTDQAMTQLMGRLEAAVGADAAAAVWTAVEQTQVMRSGLLPTLISVVTMVIGATTVFAQLQRSLNSVWSVAPRPTRNSLVGLLMTRLLSLTVVVSIGFVLLVSLLLSVMLQALLAFASDWLPIPASLAVATEWLVSLTVVTLLFAAIFKILPDVVLAWRDVLFGAVITALLFTVGRTLIAVYLANTATASVYGAAGSLVLMLLWVYYSSLILLFGAAFTRAHVVLRQAPVRPRDTAVWVRRQLEEPAGEARVPVSA